MSTIQERLEYLRQEIQAERISQGELLELQGLAEHIDPADVELLEWAGVPEFPEEEEELEIKGTITRNGITTEFSVTRGLGWQQWAGTTDQLGQNVDLLEAISAQVEE